MARGRTRPIDPSAKRPHETHWEWRSRVMGQEQMERNRKEPTVTKEAERHGNYVDEFVTHVETGTIAGTRRNRQQSSLAKMHADGQLTAEQYGAALQIARVAETIERSVSVRCASLEARVDNSGSTSAQIDERLFMVRLEVAYSKWRNRLPMPRRMIIDMVIADRSLFATARVYRMGWPKARRFLIASLDMWSDIAAETWRNVDEDELNAAHARINSASPIRACA